MVQVNPMVVKPFLVVRLRDASPPMAQAEMNSVTEAAKNWELVLADIFEKSLMKIHKKVSSWVHDDPVGHYKLVFIMKIRLLRSSNFDGKLFWDFIEDF